MSIKESFDGISDKYDIQRKQLIPCFDDFYNLPLTVMNNKIECPEILDIGAGTGLFSSFILKKYPKAKITCIDLSEKMLDSAKERFKNYPEFEYIVAAYTKYNFDKKFDIVVSALSIHHLSAFDKEKLYKNCFTYLKDDGIFINADQVLSPSDNIETLFSAIWKNSVDNCGLNKEEINQVYERISYDNPSTLNEQMTWLREAGFQEVDCLYKYYHFCIIYAKK